MSLPNSSKTQDISNIEGIQDSSSNATGRKSECVSVDPLVGDSKCNGKLLELLLKLKKSGFIFHSDPANKVNI